MTDYENEIIEIYSEFIKKDLRKYMSLLINDTNFVEDVERSKIFSTFKDLPTDKRMEMVNACLGNTARTNILFRLVLKHLYKLAIKSEDLFLDLYWKDKIKDIDII